MIGLIAFFVLAIWVMVAIGITRALARHLPWRRWKNVARVALFPLVAVLPFADEMVGRWQFERLCEQEAKVTLAPNARDILAACEWSKTMRPRNGFVFPITEQAGSYLDQATGNEFYSFKAFHTPGGLVMRIGLNLGHSSSCWPRNWTPKENGIDLDALLERGKKIGCGRAYQKADGLTHQSTGAAQEAAQPGDFRRWASEST